MKDENFTTVSNENILGVNYDEETFAFSKKELKSSEKIDSRDWTIRIIRKKSNEFLPDKIE